jgi:hypothetical protein
LGGLGCSGKLGKVWEVRECLAVQEGLGDLGGAERFGKTWEVQESLRNACMPGSFSGCYWVVIGLCLVLVDCLKVVA